MNIALLTIFGVLLAIGAFMCFRGHSPKARQAVVSALPQPPEPVPTEENFTISVPSRARLSDGKLPVSGRLAIVVKDGSQYSIWRQFPTAIRFHLLNAPAGVNREFLDRTRSISDTRETYEDYAQRPSDRIVARDFTMDLLMTFPENFTEPGSYELEAFYHGAKSNTVSFVLDR